MKYLELKLQNLMNIRNIYVTISVALTGYLFNTYNELSPAALYFYEFIDLIFMLNVLSTNNKIDRLLKLIRNKESG